jgi:hypothetical protein
MHFYILIGCFNPVNSVTNLKGKYFKNGQSKKQNKYFI